MRQDCNYFWIDGKRSDELGIVLQSPVTFSSPVPNVTAQSIPGRNGDLHFFDGSYGNVTGTVRCFLLNQENASMALSNLARLCFLEPGYHRLEVSSEPGFYRMARIAEGAETEIRKNILAPFSLAFDCKPQKFLIAGEVEMELPEHGGILYNQWFPALPLIRLYGSGSGGLVVNGVTISVSSIDEYLDLDCDIQEAYKGSKLQNNKISSNDFPVLKPGSNSIAWTGGINRVTLIPRWWTL